MHFSTAYSEVTKGPLNTMSHAGPPRQLVAKCGMVLVGKDGMGRGEWCMGGWG